MNQTTNQPNKYTQLKYKKEPLFLKLPSGNRYEGEKKCWLTFKETVHSKSEVIHSKCHFRARRNVCCELEIEPTQDRRRELIQFLICFYIKHFLS